jgi:hypothetical protein
MTPSPGATLDERVVVDFKAPAPSSLNVSGADTREEGATAQVNVPKSASAIKAAFTLSVLIVTV